MHKASHPLTILQAFLLLFFLLMTTMIPVKLQLILDSLPGSASTGSMSNIFDGKFDVHHNVAPGDVTTCTVKSTRYNSRLRCVDFCVGDIWCVAVYSKFVSNSSGGVAVDAGGIGGGGSGGGGSWECYLCIEAWDLLSLGPGSGVYAIAQYESRGMSTSLDNGPCTSSMIEGIEPMLGHIAMTCKCPHHPGNFLHFAFNFTTRSWPQYTDSCKQTHCNVADVRNVLLAMESLGNGKYNFYPICPQGETPRGPAVCQGGGVWSQTYDLCY